MLITSHMNLNDLAQRMGGACTRAHAYDMRSILVGRGWEGRDTAEVPGKDWHDMVDITIAIHRASMLDATARARTQPS
jgi:hypothetical protein